MSSKTFRFNKSRIEALPTAQHGSRDEYRDTEIKGLILRVTAGGVKTFSVSRKTSGEHFRVTLGRFPDLSVDSARTMAIKSLNEIAVSSKNPNETRREETSKLVTLHDAFEERLKVSGRRVKEATVKQYRALLQNYSSDWMKTPLAHISRERIERRHRDITQGSVWFGVDRSRLKSGVGQGSKSQADLWGRVMRSIFRFAWDHYRDAEGHSLLPEPPTMVLSTKRQWHGLVRKTERIRNTDLGRWFAAIEKVRAEAEMARDDFAHSVCDAIYLAMFTGLRKSEITHLTWSRVNISGRYFWINETKNGDPYELPMTPTLVRMFKQRHQMKRDDSDLVFPGNKGGVIGEPRRVINRIVAATVPEHNPDGLAPVEFKFHDARRTYGSAASLAKLDKYLIKRLMNHKTSRDSDVTQGYLHYGADELLEPAEQVERFILEKSGLVGKSKKLDHQLEVLLQGLSDDEKAEWIKTIINNQ